MSAPEEAPSEDPGAGAAAAESTPVRADAEWVAVRVGGVEFGLPVEMVREVLRAPPLTRLPFPPPHVLGVASVRGRIIPVLDLGDRLLGAPSDRAGRIVVALDPATGEDIGLLVDAVPGLVGAVEESHPPPAEAEATLPAGWIDRVIGAGDDRLVTLLNLEPVLSLAGPSEEERR